MRGNKKMMQIRDASVCVCDGEMKREKLVEVKIRLE